MSRAAWLPGAAKLAPSFAATDNPAEDLGPWSAWWTPVIGAYPPVFPPEMPERVQQHFLTFVLMDLAAGPVPLAAIPPHIKELLPADLVGHLRQQHPTDTDLAAKSDFEWEAACSLYSAPHYEELSNRRAMLLTSIGGAK